MTDFNSFLHSGDLGDLIYALHATKELGGGQIYLVTRKQTKAFTAERIAAVLPLLRAQSYVLEATAEEPPAPITYDFSTFREGGHPFGVNLAELQGQWVTRRGGKVSPPTLPWLEAGKVEYNGRVVVHRSPRYQNGNFPWRELAMHYGDKMLAVGFPEEVEALQKVCGRKIEFAPTSDLLEVANLIAGAGLFIGNQSSPLAIAIGLGVTVIQETCHFTPDCIYPGFPVQYVFDGNCTAIPVDGVDAPLELVYKFRAAVDRACVPPGAWQYLYPGEERKYKNPIFNNLLAEALRDARRAGDPVSREEMAVRIEDYNAERLPGFFPTPGDCFLNVKKLLAGHGLLAS